MNEIFKGLDSISKLIASIPSILALIGALVCYKFFTEEWWWLAMVYLVVLLIGKGSTKLWNVLCHWQNSRANVKYHTKKEAEERQFLMDDVKRFFLTLSEQDQNMLMEVYRIEGESTGYCNERIVPYSNCYACHYVDHLSHLESYKWKEPRFIESRNDNFNSGTPRHIWFHPYLYAIMENYAKTGIKDYPANYDGK